MPRKILFLIIGVLLCFLPNLAQAGGAINSGETKSGTIAGPSYRDSWTFDGTAGERVVFTLDFVARMGPMVRFSGTATVEGELVAESGLTFTISGGA